MLNVIIISLITISKVRHLFTAATTTKLGEVIKMAFGHPKACLCEHCEDDRPIHRRQSYINRRTDRGNFKRTTKDGTTLYGPKSTEGRPGHRHGHRGDDFDRSPHSTIGSAAIGDAHTYEDHRDNRTDRW